MKKITVLAAAFFVLGLSSKAQCDKNIKWTSSKSEFLDTSGTLQHANDEAVEVMTSPTKVSIMRHGSTEHVMKGDITNYSCNWKDKQNGKTTFKSVLLEDDKTRHATITIEAVNGKTTILLKADEEPTIIKLNVDSFEEVK
jgi:hypothetical protein